MNSKIDCHVHFLQLGRDDYAWMTPDMRVLFDGATPELLLPQMQANGVSGAILVQAAHSVDETRELLERAVDYDWVRGVVGKVEIETAGGAKQLEQFATDPLFKGIRPMLRDMRAVDWIQLEYLHPVLQRCIELDVSFECLVRPSQYGELRELLRVYPGLRAVIAHGGMPDIASGGYLAWARDVERLAGETNVYCKLSGLATQAGTGWREETLRPYVEHLLHCFGPRRLLWGSDWPVMLTATDYSHWCGACEQLFSDLDARARNAIFRDNAKRFYSLDN